MCFWLCRQRWQILFLVCLIPSSGILRYWYVIIYQIPCNALVLLWVTWYLNASLWNLFLFFFLQWLQSRIWDWTRTTMRHGWCTLVERDWYLLSLSKILLLGSPITELCFIKWWLHLMLYVDAMCKITNVADKIGVGVHFNPFVTWNGKVLTASWLNLLISLYKLTFKTATFFFFFFLAELLKQDYFFDESFIYKLIYADVQVWGCSNAWPNSRCTALGEILLVWSFTETSMLLFFLIFMLWNHFILD